MIKTNLFLLFIFVSGHALAQSTDEFALRYQQTAGNQSILFYGNLQAARHPAMNHPYFVSRQYGSARLSYRGVVYPEVMLRLDLQRHELIILSSEGLHFVLVPEYVDYAILHDHRIIYISNGDLPTGYYVVLHSGDFPVLKRTNARLVNVQQGANVYVQFIFPTVYYLYKDGVYHTIRNRRALLSILHQHRRELRQFLAANRWLNFRHNPGQLILHTVVEYERLRALEATPLS